MSYLGNSPPSQNFVAGGNQFSGTGSQTAFTLSRNVNTVFDIFVTVSNVPQDPFTAYSVSGNTLTFDTAPPAGTNNIDVVYRATNVQTFVPTPGVSASFGDVAYTGTLTGSAGIVNIGSGQLYKDTSGNVGVGTSSPAALLHASQSYVAPSSGGISADTTGIFSKNNTANGNVNVSVLSRSSGFQRIYFGNQVVENGQYIEAYNPSSTAAYLAFGTGTGGVAATERMRIDSSGNVGIGTSSPTSAVGFTPRIQATASFPAFILQGTEASGKKWTIGETTGALSFYNDTNAGEAARFDTSGNFILTLGGSNLNLNIFNTQSLAQSGYQKFPNGMIMQWGRVTMAGTSASVTFPITFPNALWCVAGIPKYGTQVGLAFNNESTSGMTLRTSINTGDYFPYIVIGY